MSIQKRFFEPIIDLPTSSEVQLQVASQAVTALGVVCLPYLPEILLGSSTIQTVSRVSLYATPCPSILGFPCKYTFPGYSWDCPPYAIVRNVNRLVQGHSQTISYAFETRYTVYRICLNNSHTPINSRP